MFLAAFTSALPAKPQAVHQKTAWLSRDFGSTCPHAEHRWLVNAGLIFSTRPGALSSILRTSKPHPDPIISRLSPDLARTFRPGCWAVPLADRVMFVIFRSSTRITSKRRAMSVDTFSNPVLASVRLAGTQPSDGVLHPPAPVRATPSAGELALQAPHAPSLPPGQAWDMQHFPGRQGRGHRHAPVDSHRLAVTRCRDRRGDHGEGDMPAPGTVQLHPVRLHPWRHGAGPAEPHPPGLRYPDLADVPAEPSHLPRFDGDDPEPLVPPGLAPRRPPSRVLRVEERGHGLGEVAQRLLLHHLGACGQPWVLGAGGGELPTLLQVARSALLTWTPVRVLLDSEVPHVPGVAAVVGQHGFLGEGGEQPVTSHTNILSTNTHISEEVKWRVVPGLKADVSTPRS